MPLKKLGGRCTYLGNKSTLNVYLIPTFMWTYLYLFGSLITSCSNPVYYTESLTNLIIDWWLSLTRPEGQAQHFEPQSFILASSFPPPPVALLLLLSRVSWVSLMPSTAPAHRADVCSEHCSPDPPPLPNTILTMARIQLASLLFIVQIIYKYTLLVKKYYRIWKRHSYRDRKRSEVVRSWEEG